MKYDTALNYFPNRHESKTVNRCLKAGRHVGEGSVNKKGQNNSEEKQIQKYTDTQVTSYKGLRKIHGVQYIWRNEEKKQPD